MTLPLMLYQKDPVLSTVFFLLIAMSVLTWYIVILRSYTNWRIWQSNKKAKRTLDDSAMWKLTDPALQQSTIPYVKLTRAGLSALQEYYQYLAHARGNLGSLGEFLTHAIRKSLAQEINKQESGMAALASISSTAPFIGLFGTVWGIYHALLGVGQQSHPLSIATISAPIGEALIATALGLATAIPAVLAYNTLARLHRIQTQHLSYFAHDLPIQLLIKGEAPV